MGADHVIDHRQPLRPQLEAAGFSLRRCGCLFHRRGIVLAANGRRGCAPRDASGLVVGLRAPLDLELIKNKSASVHWEFMFTRACSAHATSCASTKS
jgi:hypothetical protein